MPSKIQVDQIAGATGSTVTLPSGQTLDLSSGTVNLPSASLSALNATNLTSGTVPNARLSGITADKLDLISTASVPSVTAKGTPSVSDGYIQLNCEQNSHGIKIKSPPHSAGANYTMVMPNSLGTAEQVLKMNSGATALEFGTISAGKLLQSKRAEVSSIISSTNNTLKSFSANNSSSNGTQIVSVSITPLSNTSHFYCWYQSSSGVTGNDVGVTAMFHGTSLVNLSMYSGYSGDVGSNFIHGIIDTTPLSGSQTIQVRNMGTANPGFVHYINSDHTNAYNQGTACLTVIEIED